MLKCFLEDADAKKHTNALVRNTVKEIKEIVFNAEDIVESFLLKEELGKTSGIGNTVRRFPCFILERRGLASDMKAISRKISMVIRYTQSLGVQQAFGNEGYTQSLQREMRQTFSSGEEDHLVGLERSVEILVGYLVDEDSSDVVSITGMSGLGKTTLARQVFNHETIRKHFAGLAWVCVSQQFKREYVWRTILRQLGPEYIEPDMAGEELQEKLVGVLETQKALIVIDDIWNEGDWDRIKHVFLPNKGWKVLLTSRNEGVALHANPTCLNFKPEHLTFEESWNLFQRIAFPRKDTTEYKVDEELEVMGKQMIEECKGLPLAVKVLGGLLAAQYTSREWKRIYDSIRSYIFDENNINSVYSILYLSFEELPMYLKHCFLYLAHYPEDDAIDVAELSYYWAAKGIQRPMHYNRASIRDVADRYIEELVKRNIVISERDAQTSRFEICQLHDMMRVVCLRKAEEENFVQIVQGRSIANSKSPCKSRRLAVHEPDKTYEVKNPSLRSLLFISRGNLKVTCFFFTRLQLLRVLDLAYVKFIGKKLPCNIGKLIYLRYLSLRDAWVSYLPYYLNLKLLLYLNLDVTTGSPIYVPNFFKEMQELTYLYLPRRLHDKVKLELGNLVNLETLENFSTEHSSVRDLQGMTRLRNLSIIVRGKRCSMETLSSSLSELGCLENLDIEDYTDAEEEGFVLDCVNLRHLKLSIYMPRLPDEQSFPSHLRYLELSKCCLEEDPMPILEKLGHLKEVLLDSSSFCGRRMVYSRGGFPQLQKLELWGLYEWEEWIVEEGSMPLLHTLEIQDCKKLKELHDGLPFITSSKDLSVISFYVWKRD